MTALYDIYRPTEWGEILGQTEAVRSLRQQIADGRQQYILTGPSGCGKTSAARIAAKEAGCHHQNLLEQPGAINTGIDEARKIVSAISYSPMGGSKTRAVILDECHRLSAQAWDALLQPIEEPPKHVYWFLCTTEPTKLPKTLRTRCSTIAFKEVSEKDIHNILCDVCDSEKFKTPDDVIDLIVREAGGSPRMALSMLSTVSGCKGRKEAAAMLRTVTDDDGVIEFCRFLLKSGPGPGTWRKAIAALEKTGIMDPEKNVSPESVRIIVVNYMAAVLKKESNDARVAEILNIVHHFSTPYTTSDKLAPILLSLGNVVLPQI